MKKLDPISFTTFWNALVATSEEMGSILRKTAFSDVVRESRDYATSVFDSQGRMIAQGAFTPGHVGASFFAVENVLKKFPADTLQPGDMVLFNDLAMSTGHYPDIFSVAPVFHDGELVAFTVNSAHHADVGGAAPGSLVVQGVTDMYQEGIRILPVKYWEAGRPVEAVHTLISGNSRMPDKVLGDLKAQANANRAGERRILSLIETYGLEFFKDAVDELLHRSEEATREAIRQVPNGIYSFEDFLDDSGPDSDPLRIRVTVEVKDEDIQVDFEGTSPTVPAGMNCYFNYTYAYAFFSLKCLTNAAIPANDGCRRAFQVKAPKNSLLNAQYPAPGGGRALVLTRLVEVIMGALSQALPQRAIAASSDFSMSSFGCLHPQTGKPHVFYQLMIGGFGARPTKDGEEALCAALDMRNIPVEVDEANNPVFIERFELLPDTGGAGRYRGGCAIRRDVRLLAHDVQFSNLGERHRHQPFGLFGGGSGVTGKTILNPGTASEKTLHSKGTYRLKMNDVVSIRLAGAGGWGHPEEREPSRIQDDLADGYVTPEFARQSYMFTPTPTGLGSP